MADNDLIRSKRSHWVFEDLIPDETTNPEGVPVKLSPLNLRQELFVREYIKNPNLNRSDYAKIFGVKIATVDGWLSSPKVRRAIQIKMRDKLKTADLDAHWILNNTRDIVERCMASDQHGHALKGLELLGKHFEVFKDMITVEHRVEFDPSTLTIEELELVENLSKRPLLENK